MAEQLESQQQQLAIIEANADYLGAVAYKRYCEFQEKGTLVLLRQLENEGTTLEDWQLMYKPISLIPLMLSDWKEAGIQEMIVKYNPEVSVVCTFLYPNGTHTSYLFEPSQPPPTLQKELSSDRATEQEQD
ncbi:MAG: hypothetical protein RI580_14300 [Halothece sp. Uz-M2-17]|nr:hypothetical protein [Halothece sp. Uz-M2-17]